MCRPERVRHGVMGWAAHPGASSRQSGVVGSDREIGEFTASSRPWTGALKNIPLAA